MTKSTSPSFEFELTKSYINLIQKILDWRMRIAECQQVPASDGEKFTISTATSEDILKLVSVINTMFKSLGSPLRVAAFGQDIITATQIKEKSVKS